MVCDNFGIDDAWRSKLVRMGQIVRHEPTNATILVIAAEEFSFTGWVLWFNGTAYSMEAHHCIVVVVVRRLCCDVICGAMVRLVHPMHI